MEVVAPLAVAGTVFSLVGSASFTDLGAIDGSSGGDAGSSAFAPLSLLRL
jgi:hypothetical protein